LSELIGARLATLGDSQTGYLEVIALGEPLPLVVARALIPEGELAALNQAGMLAVENHGDRSSVRLGHPLYGEAIRAGLSPLRSADLWRDLAVALESSSPADTTDVRRRVLWRLEAGLPVPSSMLEHAAAVAWRQSDPVQAERFARKALAQGHREASVVLAEALASLGRWRETAEVMSTVDTATVTVDHQCRLLRLRMWQCLFLGHIGTAEETMAEVESLATDATLRDSARALRAVVAFYGGNTERGVNWSEELSAREGLNEQARRLASSALANALAFSGRGDYAVEVATAELTRLGVGETLAFAPHQLMWGFFFGLWRSGRFAEAEPAVNSYYQASIDLCDPSLTPIALSVLGIHLCQVGRIAESRRILAEAVEGLARSDPLHYQAIIAAYLAIAAASGGDLAVVTR